MFCLREAYGWTAGPQWPAVGSPCIPVGHSQRQPSTVSPEGEGGSGISPHEEENSSCPLPIPPFSLPQGQAWSLSPSLTLKVLPASEAVVCQQLGQIEVQLSKAARVPQVWDLCHLHLP